MKIHNDRWVCLYVNWKASDSTKQQPSRELGDPVFQASLSRHISSSAMQVYVLLSVRTTVSFPPNFLGGCEKMAAATTCRRIL